ncbi:HEL296Cp [Eremothecium sinecaudum]|uniref:HEL296Cp n=1 Tax=Eremothecium sinecaudum TaxID=45286 RepID=A0A109UZ71_9SACH|nr:HEL296Cp [Eremothecium sinecaudum]AMD20985.1 HEL296Cp [Eremothecium sinecaudum]
MNRSRPAFLDQEPPPGYIAGVGRGATGFATRSDLGVTNSRKPNRTRDGSSDFLAAEATKDAAEDEIEAENIYSMVEERLASKKKAATGSKQEASQSAVGDQFVDLKRHLATLTDNDWLNIPEAGDSTRKNKRQRLEAQQQRKTYAAPDSLLSGRGVNLMKLTEERERLLGHQLDTEFDQTLNKQQREVDDYLQQLNSEPISVTPSMDVDAQDLPKMRAILASYRKTDPTKPYSWIASARLEERARRFQVAKAIIDEGCQQCPKEEDVWLENIRLNQSDLAYCKDLVAQAVQFNVRSERLWLKAVELEQEQFNKARVVRKALQQVPKSETFWKMAVQLESNRNAALRVLEKATDLVPTSISLWTALIKLQDLAHKRETLDKARKAVSDNEALWIITAEIEEESGTADKAQLVKLLREGIELLRKGDKCLTLEEWMVHCKNIEAERSYPLTISALLEVVLAEQSADSADLLATIDGLGDDAFYTKKEAIAYLLSKEPSRLSIWTAFINLGRKTGKMKEIYDACDRLLFEQNIIKERPVLLLIYVKEIWKRLNDVHGANKVLERGLKILPSYLDFWLAKIKLQIAMSKNQEAERTFILAINTLGIDSTTNLERLWYKYASFLRFLGKNKQAVEILNDAIAKYPACEKLRLQLSQVYVEMSLLSEAREVLTIASKEFPSRPKFWVQLAKLDEQQFQKTTSARSDLDLGLLKNPGSWEIYVARAQMEVRVGNKNHAILVVQEGLRKCPENPNLWCLNIQLVEKKSLRKTMFQQALKSTNNNGLVLTEIGKSFYKEGQIEKALRWFQHATETHPKSGDAWAWYYKLLKQTDKDTAEVEALVEEHEPKYGDLWISVSKDVKTQYKSPSDILKLCNTFI